MISSSVVSPKTGPAKFVFTKIEYLENGTDLLVLKIKFSTSINTSFYQYLNLGPSLNLTLYVLYNSVNIFDSLWSADVKAESVSIVSLS